MGKHFDSLKNLVTEIERGSETLVIRQYGRISEFDLLDYLRCISDNVDPFELDFDQYNCFAEFNPKDRYDTERILSFYQENFDRKAPVLTGRSTANIETVNWINILEIFDFENEQYIHTFCRKQGDMTQAFFSHLGLYGIGEDASIFLSPGPILYLCNKPINNMIHPEKNSLLPFAKEMIQLATDFSHDLARVTKIREKYFIN